jgi:hypothetical protein
MKSVPQVYPLFNSIDEIWNVLKGYYDDFNLSIIKECYNHASPWRLLGIFLQNKFIGDFNDKFSCINSEICWHLTALSKAISCGSIDLFYGEKIVVPFTYSPGHNFGMSQAKLFFSFASFVLGNLSYSSFCDVGAGEGKGGYNHLMLYQLLNEKYPERLFTFNLIDPLHEESVETIGNCVVTHEKRRVLVDESFNCPVFCDVIFDGEWNELQESIKAPQKMMKSIFRKGEPNMLIQPYHHEVRIFENEQLPFLLKSFSVQFIEFDNCADCLLWKGFCLQYDISPDLVAKLLRSAGVRSCCAYDGAGLAANLSFVVNEKNFALQEFFELPERKITIAIDPKFGKHFKKESVIASDWHNKIIQYLKITNTVVHELIDSSVTPLVRYDRSVVSGSGVIFAHELQRVPRCVDEFMVDLPCDRVNDVDTFVADKGYIIVETFGDGYRTFIRCVSTNDTIRMTHDILDIEYAWVNRLPGYMLSLPCPHHKDVYCKGLWCTMGSNYAVWCYFDKMALVRYNVTSKSFDDAIALYHNYAFPPTDKWKDIVLSAYFRDIRAQINYQMPNVAINSTFEKFILLILTKGAMFEKVKDGVYFFICQGYKILWYDEKISVILMKPDKEYSNMTVSRFVELFKKFK